MENNNQMKSPTAWILSLLFVIIILLCFKSWMSDDNSENNNSVGINEAFIISKDYVEENLKSPSTADFSGEYSYNEIGYKEYVIKSNVDAENSFGAKLHTNWVVKIKYNAGDWADKNSWTLEFIQIE